MFKHKKTAATLAVAGTLGLGAVFVASTENIEQPKYPAISFHADEDTPANRIYHAKFYASRGNTFDEAVNATKAKCTWGGTCTHIVTLNPSDDKQCIVVWGGDFGKPIKHAILTGDATKDVPAIKDISDARRSYYAHAFSGICNENTLIPYAQKAMTGDASSVQTPPAPPPQQTWATEIPAFMSIAIGTPIKMYNETKATIDDEISCVASVNPGGLVKKDRPLHIIATNKANQKIEGFVDWSALSQAGSSMTPYSCRANFTATAKPAPAPATVPAAQPAPREATRQPAPATPPQARGPSTPPAKLETISTLKVVPDYPYFVATESATARSVVNDSPRSIIGTIEKGSCVKIANVTGHGYAQVNASGRLGWVKKEGFIEAPAGTTDATCRAQFKPSAPR